MSNEEVLNLGFALSNVGLALALFAGILFFIELGRRFGGRQLARYGADARAGVGIVDGAIFSLLAFLIGFTFSGAASRFDDRRELIGREANAISTAWDQIDLLPPERQEPLRAAFRRYLDALIDAYTKPLTVKGWLRETPAAERTREEVWVLAVAACLDPAGEKARMLLLPALTDMFGLVETERTVRRIHQPVVIFAMVGITALAAALLAGYGMAAAPTRNWTYIIGFATAVSIATFVIIDLEFPRLGFIRVDMFDRTIVELRATLK